jgi:hypothetical protein
VVVVVIVVVIVVAVVVVVTVTAINHATMKRALDSKDKKKYYIAAAKVLYCTVPSCASCLLFRHDTDNGLAIG